MGVYEDMKKDYEELGCALRVLERYGHMARPRAKRQAAMAKVHRAMEMASAEVPVNGQPSESVRSQRVSDSVLTLITGSSEPIKTGALKDVMTPQLKLLKHPDQAVYGALYRLRKAKRIRRTPRGWTLR